MKQTIEIKIDKGTDGESRTHIARVAEVIAEFLSKISDLFGSSQIGWGDQLSGEVTIKIEFGKKPKPKEKGKAALEISTTTGRLADDKGRTPIHQDFEKD